uniref:Choline/carnitine acyltransferase domain-containing protein n=2 Tax=Cryptomonas curvata TaxID=233186 RepID=A0A6T8DEQ1_9CRYP|mmetsp:Transcript_59769/g.124914  ORF Transcript_59769/g.124914 Transcript_59769/m.124914 type:complete len:683 (+) Transcript_59769:257-2305(+)
MAEARAAVNTLRVGTLSLEQVTSAAKLRGVQVHGVDGGILIVIPSVKFLWRQLVGRIRYIGQNFQTLCWPAPVWGVLVAIALFTAAVLNSASDSWLRNNWVANFLWSVDENLIGFLSLSEYFPRGLRILYISSYTAMASLLFLSLLNRLVMRIFLQYRGWMYERKPSIATKIWGALMKSFFLGQGQSALMYSFQNAMPRLPVPPLKETINKYLRSVEPLLKPDEFSEVETQAQLFLKGEGANLQRFLVAKSWLSGNYVSDWWEKYIYLRSRSPILINSNYYGLGYAYHIPSAIQTARAGVLVHYFAKYKRRLDSEQLPPTTIRGLVPVCMRQFERIFATTRIPGRDSDLLKHISGQTTTHVAVLYKGTYWRVDTLSDSGLLLQPFQLQDQFEALMSAVDNADSSGLRVPGKDDPEANIAALTAWNRTRWAEVREDYFGEGLNRMSLEEIESSIFVLHLDDRAPADWTESGHLSLHGGGTCRWCDKSFNLLVFANGQATVHAEHSWADAPVIAYSWEWVLSHESISKVYDKAGNCLRPEASVDTAALAAKPKKLALRGPTRLEWLLHAKAREAIAEAVVHAKALCEDIDLVVDCFATKTGGCAPSARRRDRKSKLRSESLNAAQHLITAQGWPDRGPDRHHIHFFVISLEHGPRAIFIHPCSFLLILTPQIRQGSGQAVPVRT